MPLYDGVDGVARKVTKIYDGVDGVARNVAKVYSGVDNVARLCYTSGVKWYKYPCTLEERYKRVNCNLFNPSKLIEDGWTVDGKGIYSGLAGTLHTKYNPNTNGYMSLEGLESATFSFYARNDRTDNVNGLIVYFVYDDNTNNYIVVRGNVDKLYTLKSLANKKLKKLCFSYGGDGQEHYLHDIQLEVGTTPNPYVPYQTEKMWVSCKWDSGKEQAFLNLYSDYSFKPEHGFTLPSQYQNTFYFDRDVTVEDLQCIVGYYNPSYNIVRKIVEVTDWQSIDTVSRILCSYEIVERVEQYYVYLPSTETCEELTVPPNEFPGEGELVEGSFDEPYYILFSEGNYYYYSKEML